MNEPATPQQDKRPDPPGVPATSDTQPSGGKGLAIILGAMLGIIGLLWLVAALVTPH